MSDSLYALLPELTLLMQPRPSPHTSLSLRFNVHWTRVSARPPCVPRTALPPGMYIDPGRPDIFDTLQSVITSVRSAYSTSRDSGHPSGIVIGSCGPVALIDDAARAVGRVGWADWKDVGGVESIEECAFSSSIVVLASSMLKGYRTGYLGCNNSPSSFFSSILIALHADMNVKDRCPIFTFIKYECQYVTYITTIAQVLYLCNNPRGQCQVA
jgi:hypothetical protein